MPITQDRMIDLIHEVEKISAARQNLLQDASQTLLLYRDKNLSAMEALDVLITLLNQQHDISLPAYNRERAHFLKHEVRNERQRRFMDGQRRLQGVPQGHGPRQEFNRPVQQAQQPAIITLPPEYYASLQQAEQTTSYQPLSGSGWKKALPKTSDATPDLTEYQTNPPDFKKSIF